MRILSIFLLLLPLVFAQNSSISLPALLGAHKVGTRTLYLPGLKTQSPRRDIMISIFYPTRPNINTTDHTLATVYDEAYASYLETSIGLPAGLAGSILSQDYLNAPLYAFRRPGQPRYFRRRDHGDIVFFSPGYGNSRLDYTATLSNLASRGYIAIGVDHPNDTSFISYPDGRNLTHTPLNLTATTAADVVDLRVRDMRFVLDALTHRVDVLPNLKKRLDLNKVSIFGHSLGGAAAAATIHADKRFIAGVNLDGALWGEVVQKGVKKPFMILAAQNHTSANDDTWSEFWKNSKGGAYDAELQIEGARHGTFSDQAVLYGMLRAAGLIPDLDPTGQIFGTITGDRILQIEDAYLTAFFDFAFSRRKDKILKGSVKTYPEVTFYPI